MLKIFVSIQTGMTNNWSKCQGYVRTWDSYREIWEINKGSSAVDAGLFSTSK